MSNRSLAAILAAFVAGAVGAALDAAPAFADTLTDERTWSRSEIKRELSSIADEGWEMRLIRIALDANIYIQRRCDQETQKLQPRIDAVAEQIEQLPEEARKRYRAFASDLERCIACEKGVDQICERLRSEVRTLP